MWPQKVYEKKLKTFIPSLKAETFVSVAYKQVTLIILHFRHTESLKGTELTHRLFFLIFILTEFHLSPFP